MNIAIAVITRQSKKKSNEEDKIATMDNIQAMLKRKSGKPAVTIISPSVFCSRI
jgi:hypothetical protein